MLPSTFRGVAIAALAFAVANPASANLIFDSTIDATAQGFGNQSNILTLHKSGGEGGASDVEEGSVAWDGGPLKVCTGNGFEICDDGKTDVFTLGFLDVDNANELNLIWNPAEVGNTAGLVTQVDEATVTLFRPNGTTFFSASLAAPVNHPTTDPGHGGAGFVYILDTTQAAALNTLLGSLTTTEVANLIVGFASSVSFADNGPDTWTIRNLCPEGETCTPPPCTENCFPQQVPEPQSLLLVALGLLGLASVRRFRITR